MGGGRWAISDALRRRSDTDARRVVFSVERILLAKALPENQAAAQQNAENRGGNDENADQAERPENDIGDRGLVHRLFDYANDDRVRRSLQHHDLILPRRALGASRPLPALIGERQ